MSAGSHLDNTLGAIQIASILSSVVFGITILQTYTYLHRGSSDPTWFKAAISLISALGILHEILTSYTSYTFMVTDFGDPIRIVHMTWSTDALVIVSSVMSACSRFIFILRIWRLSKEWTPAITIAVFSLGELVALVALVITIEVKIHILFPPSAALSPEVYIATVCATISDLLITISQVVLLRKCRRTRSRTNSVLQTLMIYSINTGSLTTIWAMMTCIMWISMPDNLIYVVFFFPLPVLHFNALLAVLNARHKLRERVHGEIDWETLRQVSVVSQDVSELASVHALGPNNQEMHDSVMEQKVGH